ncbi:MAG: hypothetical protein E7649_01820 [Ruminococcaceae bacterium]|nr:hypothetical protein [Oscillospiraceae bacterium]
MKKYSVYLFILLLLVLCLSASACNDAPCKHPNINSATLEATCLAAGKTTYTCPDCQFTYVDKIIEPKGHTYKAAVTPPTCENGGYTTYTCDCGHSYVSDYTKALGHDYTKEFYTIPPTCMDQGYTFYACSDCESSYTTNYVKPTGHTLSATVTDATCSSEGYTTYKCDNCAYTFVSDYTKPLAHDYTDNIIVTAPTCTEQGYTTYKCNACEHEYISSFTPPAGHDYTDSTVTVHPTCTEQGYTTYNCNNCEHSYASDFTQPTDHVYVEQTVSAPTCTEVGVTKYACSCGEEYTITVEATGHDFTRTVTMPTLSDMGFTDFYCEICKYSYTGDLRFYNDILPNGAYALGSEVKAIGIDISEHNYNGIDAIDFAAIKASGVDYVIIKAGSSYREGYTLGGIDPRFEQSYADAKAAGLDVGVYFYTYATTVEDIVYDAHLLLSILDGKQFEYPIYLDLEDDSLLALDSATLTQMCVEFFTVLQRAGYYTGLYVNNEWLTQKIQTDVALSKFEIWYARYPGASDSEIIWNTELYGAHLGMWQYSDKGEFEAIPDIPFDLNYAYKDYPAIITAGGFNGYDADVSFVDDGKDFVYVIANAMNIRSTPDFDSEENIIGIVYKGARFEVLEKTDDYTMILYNGLIAYISANPLYVSFEIPTFSNVTQ